MPSDPPLQVHEGRSSETTAPPPATLGTLARKIRSRTTDLVAIGIVLIAGLTFGRQVLNWWHADDPSPSAPSAAVASSIWGGDGSPVDLRFGDSPLGMSRQVIVGTVAEAQQKLLALCSEKTRAAALPESPIQPSEQKMLERVSGETPALQESGAWMVYLLEQPMPLALGVRITPVPAGMQGRGVEEGLRRVVCWAWLFPQGKGSFTVFCVQAAGSSSSDASKGVEPPLPTGSHRLLSLRGTREGELISFTGSGSVEAWKDFYDDWGRKQGWGPMEWQRVGAGWSGRHRDPATGREMTWHFTPKNPGTSGSGEWLGLIDLISIREPRGNP